MKATSGLLPFDGFPSAKAVVPEESKELLTTVVTPTGGLTSCVPGGLPGSLSGPIFTCLSIGTVLHIIGITTTAWSSKWRYREGLWESCTCDQQKDVADWFRSTQILVGIGMSSIALAICLSIAYIWVPRMNKILTLYAIVAVCFLAGFFLFLGLAVFGSHRDHLNRSFIMTSIASAMSIVACCLALYQLRRGKVRE